MKDSSKLILNNKIKSFPRDPEQSANIRHRKFQRLIKDHVEVNPKK